MKRHSRENNRKDNDEHVTKTEASYDFYDTIPDDYFGYHELAEVPKISTYGVLHENQNSSVALDVNKLNV